MISLSVPWVRFNSCSLLNVAWGAHSRSVLGTRPAQEILQKRWRGGIRRHVAFYKTFFVSLCPLLLLFSKAIPFRPHVLYQTKNKEAERVSALTDERRRTGIVGWARRVHAFYSSPYIKFQNHAFFYILFLLLHIYVVLFKLHKGWTFDPALITLVTVLLMYLVEEIRQFFATDHMFRHSYFENAWNRIDAIMFILYLSSLFILGVLSDYGLYPLARALLCLNTLVLFTRLMFICNSIPELGTLLLILREMTNDLLNISVFIFIFLLGYGVALMGVLVDPADFASHNLFGVFFFPYFQIYGEMQLDDLISHQNTSDGVSVYLQTSLSKDDTSIDFLRVTAIVLMAIYMIAVAIGFINLLIAMFSDTYRRIKDDQLSVWKYMRFGICEEYESAIITPPFTILVYLFFLGRVIWRRWCRPDGPSEGDQETRDNENRILRWKEHVLESLMKEASISYLRKKGQFELNIRSAMLDESKPLADQITLLNLQNRVLKERQKKMKKSSTLTKIKFRSKKRKESVAQFQPQESRRMGGLRALWGRAHEKRDSSASVNV